MELLLDTADLGKIRECYEILDVKGVTTNPSILARTVKDNPYRELRLIKDFLAGVGGELYVQTLSNEKGGIIREAETLISLYGKDLFIKIPATMEGLKAIKDLSRKGVRTTATAVLSFPQGLYAALNGAVSLAVYCNRMEEQGIDYGKVIADLKKAAPECRILAASFRTMDQVRHAVLSGAESCTVSPALILSEINRRAVKDAVAGFESDWEKSFGEWSVTSLFSV